MSFLVIIIIVLLAHQEGWLQCVQRDAWFYKLSNISGSFSKTSGFVWASFILVILFPVFCLIIVLFQLSEYWWLVFSINLVVLAYAMGRKNWRKDCAVWVGLFLEQEAEALKKTLAESEEHSGTDWEKETIEDIWQQARSDVLQNQLINFYAVIFWFFLLGAPAALFYRLLCLHQEKIKEPVNDNDKNNPIVLNRLLWLVEWLPVRLMSLLFCLVGNFSTAFWVFKQAIQDAVSSSADVLARSADAALFLDSAQHKENDKENNKESDEESNARDTSPSEDVEHMTLKSLEVKTLAVMRGYSLELQTLLQHMEVAFLAAIAVVTLL